MKIGDLVSALDEDLKGRITAVHGTRIAFVDEFGFVHQMEASKLVLQAAHLYASMEVPKKMEASPLKSKRHSAKTLVLDLHFDKLVSHPSHYSATERFFLQKEKLLQTLSFCRTNKIKKLEIIHGIGEGTLQQGVQEILESQAGLEFHHNAVLPEQSGSVTVFF